MGDVTTVNNSLKAPAEGKHFSRVIPREEWGAIPPLETSPLNPPIEKIYYSFHRNWRQCFNQEECSRTLRMMQLREMNEWGHPDVRHNFMIGHDCNVYEGRGWYAKPKPVSLRPPIDEIPKEAFEGFDPEVLKAMPPLPPKNLEAWDDKAMNIGFFAEDPDECWPFEEMFGVAQEFINYGVENKLIIKDWEML